MADDPADAERLARERFLELLDTEPPEPEPLADRPGMGPPVALADHLEELYILLHRRGYGRVAEAGSPDRARDALLAETRDLLERLEAVAPTAPEPEELADALRETRRVLDAIERTRDPGPEAAGERLYDLWSLVGLLDALGEAGVRLLDALGEAGVSAPVSADSGAVAALTLRLARMPDTVAMELNLAGLPLYSESRQAIAQLTLWASGSMHGHPVRIVQGLGPMDDRGYRLLAHIIRRYAEDGCPPERRVYFTKSEAARWAGYGKGGRQLRLIRDELLRMRATAIESAVRYPDGHTEALAWGLIDRGWTTAAVRASGGFVTLSEELSGLVRQGSLVYLDAPTLDALGELDGMAVILWGFLEAESSTPWRYRLFSAQEGYPPVDDRGTLAIADLLRVSGWARRRRAVARVRDAAAVLMAVDPRYRLSIDRAKGRGMWTLTMARGAGTARGAMARGAGTARGARAVLSGAEARTLRSATGYSPGRTPDQKRGVPSVSTVGSNDSLATTEKRANARRPRATRAAVQEAERRGRPDIAALLDRTGWTRLTPKARDLLDDLADRHDLTGYDWAAGHLRDAPVTTRRPGDDLLRYLLEADKAWRDAQLEAADRRELEERRHRAEERREAAASPLVQQLVSAVRPGPPTDPETMARRRLEALELLRSGLDGRVADRLRADYGITPEEERTPS